MAMNPPTVAPRASIPLERSTPPPDPRPSTHGRSIEHPPTRGLRCRISIAMKCLAFSSRPGGTATAFARGCLDVVIRHGRNVPPTVDHPASAES